ncbi:hypothetical protein F2Q69_00028856 [Brassica cretica]|uniref:Uncharacterized protein n=1 Tax=Brassica cretica TaxID=69181 RepID=A0A8S9S9L6_BRACR|nr:hypothetical protein F2Q69_00028856 [Brassica cretica]
MIGSPSFKGIEYPKSSENRHELSNTQEKGSLRKPITPSEETSELQAPPPPRRHQKPRTSPSPTRNQRFNSARPRSGVRELVLPRVQIVVPAGVEAGITGLLERCPA